jgi:hypothetical protein
VVSLIREPGKADKISELTSTVSISKILYGIDSNDVTSRKILREDARSVLVLSL